ncbi:MAG: hypothetical protein PVH84_18400 [Candidatus Aminicenantes bacterium]|jgi:choline dehydrogenase-like flavoprotein
MALTAQAFPLTQRLFLDTLSVKLGSTRCVRPSHKVQKGIDDNQETEIKGLFLNDASVFPTPLGIPPSLTIVALSKRLANHLKARS